ncbi:MAG: cell division protein FtsZ [Ruminococcaceae bacterium]|nr:cell division protein FtsZ [Oscillospiraceae bacterium]
MPFDTNDSITTEVVKIKVLGVGGGGNNAVNKMIKNNMQGVEFLAVNTDKAALIKNSAERKIVIGEKITKGHGAGANPEIGQRAAEETLEEVLESIKDAHMLFITCGMGGGTGTGAAPVIAKAARDMGILTVGIVTKPFAFEGKKRMEQAEMGIARLRENVDSLIVIPNERLKLISETRITLLTAFDEADSVLARGVMSITELVSDTALINLDFADVTTAMKDAGLAHMGVGNGEGKEKAEIAAKMAISSPLLETSISGARAIIVNITAGPDVGLEETEIASSIVAKEAMPDATIIWGVAIDETFEDKMKVTVIATGFDKKPAQAEVAEPVVADEPVAKTEEESKPDVFNYDDPIDALVNGLMDGKKNNN